MACGSHSGTVTLLELSDGLCNIQRNEKASVTAVRTEASTQYYTATCILHCYSRGKSVKDVQRVAQKPHFSPIPLLWTGFWLISIRMAKNEFCKKKGTFSDQSDVVKQFFYFSRMRKSQNLFSKRSV